MNIHQDQCCKEWTRQGACHWKIQRGGSRCICNGGWTRAAEKIRRMLFFVGEGKVRERGEGREKGKVKRGGGNEKSTHDETTTLSSP